MNQVAGLLETLSLLVHEFFPRRCATYWRNRYGAVYVGELFLEGMIDAWRSGGNSIAARVCCETLASAGIPFDLDLNEVGWEPPYAKDLAVLKAWSRRLHEWEVAWCHSCRKREEGGCETVGEFLRQRHPLRVRQHWLRYRYEQPLREHGLRPTMFVPKTWHAPARDWHECIYFRYAKWDGELVPVEFTRALEEKGFTSFQSLQTETRWSLTTMLSKAVRERLFPILERRNIRLREPTLEEVEARKFEEKIDECPNFSLRTYNALRNGGVEVYGQLLEKTGAELLRVPNFGRRSLNEVEAFLASRGDRLRALEE